MQTILVPVDFSDSTDAVIREAALLSRAFSVSLTLLHVAAPEPEFVGYDPGPQSVRDTVAREIHEEHQNLHTLEKNLQAEGIPVTALLVQGAAAEKILSEADKTGAGIIVMGSHGHSALHHLLVGSVAEAVMRKTKVPVHVVPSQRNRDA